MSTTHADNTPHPATNSDTDTVEGTAGVDGTAEAQKSEETPDAAVRRSPDDVDASSSGLLGLVRVGRPTGWVLLILGVIGFVAAATLTIEKIHLLQNPDYVPSCSINPVISCGSVMKSWQAGLFGFPNPLIGIAAFSVVIVTGVLAVAGISLPRWYWLGLALGSFAGFVFVNFLAYSALYKIHALCPYCLVVWVVVPIILILSINRVIGDSDRGREIRGWLWVLLPVWYAIVIAAILVEFWDYWQTFI
ncbi:vitamin K epoxide reductase family protein [Gordonia otitidis]|uniref:vitamin K epoxide reductase family protein n=1 Tax=Gordonia otitidis TaxID=249058 RepID=UPI001D13BE24|nr:vitamin K epoxide reductase family protein [Gordonia otitidis]UEA58063.1 vitamin K epoxide reductase family protein [Gordonia otitidis]